MIIWKESAPFAVDRSMMRWAMAEAWPQRFGQMEAHGHFPGPAREGGGGVDNLPQLGEAQRGEAAALEAAGLGVGDDVDEKPLVRECRSMVEDGPYAIG